MPYTTIQDKADQIDEAVETFAGTVTSVDAFSMTTIGSNRVVALIEYTA